MNMHVPCQFSGMSVTAFGAEAVGLALHHGAAVGLQAAQLPQGVRSGRVAINGHEE